MYINCWQKVFLYNEQLTYSLSLVGNESRDVLQDHRIRAPVRRWLSTHNYHHHI